MQVKPLIHSQDAKRLPLFSMLPGPSLDEGIHNRIKPYYSESAENQKKLDPFKEAGQRRRTASWLTEQGFSDNRQGNDAQDEEEKNRAQDQNAFLDLLVDDLAESRDDEG